MFRSGAFTERNAVLLPLKKNNPFVVTGPVKLIDEVKSVKSTLCKTNNLRLYCVRELSYRQTSEIQLGPAQPARLREVFALFTVACIVTFFVAGTDFLNNV